MFVMVEMNIYWRLFYGGDDWEKMGFKMNNNKFFLESKFVSCDKL